LLTPKLKKAEQAAFLLYKTCTHAPPAFSSATESTNCIVSKIIQYMHGWKLFFSSLQQLTAERGDFIALLWDNTHCGWEAAAHERE
jgi:hypothetical protein